MGISKLNDLISKNFKVAIMNDLPIFSGIGSYSYDLNNLLNSNGVDSFLYQITFSNDIHISNERVVQIQGWEPPFWEKYNLTINQLLNLNYRRMRNVKSDIVHISAPDLIGASSYFQNLIVTVHDLYYLSSHKDSCIIKHYNISLYRKLDRAYKIITVSEFVKKEVINKLKIDSGKIVTIPNSIDTAFFKPGKSDLRSRIGLKDDDVVILNVGNDQENKNLLVLLKTLVLLEKRFKLIRVGNNRPEFLNNLKKFNLSSRVLLFQNIDKILLRELYRISDFYVQTSLYEGFGRPVVEAMSCGNTVIVSDSGSLPEIVGSGAYVVRQMDEFSLSEKIKEALIEKNEELLRIAILQSTKFSPQKIFDTISKVYLSVMNATR